MGYGKWDRDTFSSYSKSKGYDVDDRGSLRDASSYSAQEMFKSRYLTKELDPHNVNRECCDSDEHPNTIPVILALDVTGSMGRTAVEVASKLNVIMTELYKKVTDIEFMIMGIGDFAYDSCPLQVSQFESDIRIAEQLDKIYFEGGGGGNSFESYTASWYFASRHTKLDCWKRGKKGILITIGDEELNPYIPYNERFKNSTGDSLQGDIETKDLYNEVKDKYDLYHVDVNHRTRYGEDDIRKTFCNVLGKDHFVSVHTEDVSDAIINIIMKCIEQLADSTENVESSNSVKMDNTGAIFW